LEQDADIVTTIYREGYYDKTGGNSEPQPAEWDVAKHREGKTGTMKMVWHPEWTRFDGAQITRLTDEPATQQAAQIDLHEVNAILNE
jgi:replicative DNA helicase